MYAPQCSLYPAIIFTVCFWYLLRALVTQCIGNTFIATQSQITKKQRAHHLVARTVVSTTPARTGEPSHHSSTVGMLSLHKGLSKASEQKGALVETSCYDFTLGLTMPIKTTFYRCLSGCLFLSVYWTHTLEKGERMGDHK